MSETCVLEEKQASQNEWISPAVETNGLLSIPNSPSAFANGVKDLCESRVSLVCGVPSQPCSG